jgi:3'(2'), 5'-bisphosphate nucleotidase
MTTRANRVPTTLPESLRFGVGARADDLGAAATAALAGGAAALRHYGLTDLAVEDGARGPRTAADRASHEAILETLATLRAGDPVRSEEGSADASAGADGRLWVIDPLDGTREFIAGIDEFSVMVGLAQDGEALLGAVYRPAVDRLFVGVSGAGAWRVGVRGGRPEASPLRVDGSSPTHLRTVESRSHPDVRLRRLAARLSDRFVCVTVRCGSAGTKCTRVAAGEADLYVHPVPHLREWDTCAGEAVARGAGARVGSCTQEKLRYGKSDPSHPNGIFVAPPAVWERVAADVASVAPDRA